jgi:uncharacterized membrane protein
MNMELTWPEPEDDRGAQVQTGRNISGFEKWASIAVGSGLAVYGLARLKSNGWLWAGMGGLLLRRGVSAHCDIYEALGVNTARTTDARSTLSGGRGVNVLEGVTINRDIYELYRFWRNLENLPRFMRHLLSVERLTDTISRWRAKGPGGMTVDWEAEIYNEVPGKLIAWRSLEGSTVVSAGSVNFDPASPEPGTRVTVHLQYSPPGGKLGARVAKLFGRDAGTEIRQDLRRFKRLLEASEVDTASGQSSR